MTGSDQQHDHVTHGFADLNVIQQFGLLLVVGWPLWFLVSGLSIAASVGLEYAGLIETFKVAYWPFVAVLWAVFMVWLYHDAKREWT